jgi:3-oxoacyl-[acyl-carrier-protein] synthase-3
MTASSSASQRAAISAVEYYLPEGVLTTEALSQEFPEWSVEKIDQKTGIRTRHIASADECSSDLACRAAEKLFESGACTRDAIDYVLLCTQSPDYFLPTTACILQNRLGIPTTAGALDFNLGCSGYVYGLGLAQGLIETGQAQNVLLITAETYSKFLHAQDRSVRTIFGDAAAATLITAVPSAEPLIGPYVYGTDGSGAEWLMVRTGGMRERRTGVAETREDDSGNLRSDDNLYMNGPEIFSFTLSAVPAAVAAVLKKSGLSQNDIDLFVFHQANKYMLDTLRRKIGIPADKFLITMSDCGNTVSSTIPIALKHAQLERRLQSGSRVMLVGFGVGLSWAATLVRWHDALPVEQ